MAMPSHDVMMWQSNVPLSVVAVPMNVPPDLELLYLVLSFAIDIPSVSAKTVQWAGPWRILIGYLNIRSSLIGWFEFWRSLWLPRKNRLRPLFGFSWDTRYIGKILMSLSDFILLHLFIPIKRKLNLNVLKKIIKTWSFWTKIDRQDLTGRISDPMQLHLLQFGSMTFFGFHLPWAPKLVTNSASMTSDGA